MSKISIEGNASGTGTLTIAAPNTNTNYTLALPAETGTVLTSGGAIDVNASAPADSLAINASGLIQVGTTTTNGQVNIAKSGGNQLSLIDSSGSSPGIRFANSSNTAVAFIEAPAGNGLSFFSASTERARITSGGDFQMNSGYGSVATAFGCRAWVNFNGTGSTSANQTIRGSGNVTSIFKNGSGSYTMNFTNTMPDANYGWSIGGDGSGGRSIAFGIAETNVAAPTSSAFRMKFYDDTAAIIDPTYASVSIHR